MQRRCLAEMSPERERELAEEEGFLHQRLAELAQESALQERRAAPIASFLLRERLLNQIQPPGLLI